MWRTPATLRGLARRRARTPARAVPRDPRARDELRRHLRRGRRRATGEIRSNVISSQGVHDRFGGVVPGDRLAPPPRARQRGRRRRARRRPARRSTTSSWSPSRRARAWSARCSSASRRPRRWPPRASCRSRRSTTCRATSPRTSSAPDAVRAAVPVPDRQRRPHAAGARRRPRRLRGARRGRSTTPRARRSTRARGCSASAIPGGPALERLRRASGDPARASRSRSRRARVAGPRLLVRRPEDRAALQGARPRRGARPRERAPTSPPPTSARSSRRSSRASSGRSTQTGLGRLAIGGGVAANGALRERLAGARRRACTSRRASCAPTTRR